MNGQACEQLTLFQGDSPVSPFPWLESKKVKGMTATSGLKCSELSESLRRVGYSVRTYLESCELPPGTWSRTWSARALTSRCLILKLRLSARSTGERESRLLPTVTATVGEKGGPNQRDSSGRPGLQMAAQLWQTPNAPNGGRVNPPEMSPTGMMPDGSKRQVGLEHQVKMVDAGLWPTPRASDYKGCGPVGSSSAEHHLKRGQLSGVVLYPTPRAQSATGPSEAPNRQGSADLQSVAGGTLNPTWVEWLMGFPLGWTDLSASETP